MSTLKVNAIRQTGASSDAITLAADGGCTAKVTNNLGNKNLFLNGQMQVNQREASAGLTDFNPVTGTIYTLDRWQASTGSSFDWDSARVKQMALSPDGFSNSLRVDIGNTETPSGGQNAAIRQKIEAQNLQHLKYGTSDAETCTVSFWVYSNKTGTYCAQIQQYSAAKYLLYEYTINSANTWEKKTITFSGNTADTIPNDNSIGLEVDFHLTCGPDDHVAATTSWTANGGSGTKYLATSSQVNLWDNSSNYWYITGIQLEVGDVATDFEYRSYADELLRCRRYYYDYIAFGDPANVSFGTLIGWSATEVDHPVKFPVPMRAVPTLDQTTGANYFQVEGGGIGTTYVDGNWTLQFGTINGCNLYATPDSNVTAGYVYHMVVRNASAKVCFEAEL